METALCRGSPISAADLAPTGFRPLTILYIGETFTKQRPPRLRSITTAADIQSKEAEHG